jgi:ferric-dicitrate binding protein FerR (iron transport regulator)
MEDATWWFVELITAANVNSLWPKFERWLHQNKNNQRAYEAVERAWCRWGRPVTLSRRPRVSFSERTRLH